MEIVKKLILNKTPKDMPYGSISCAKNMMVDDTGSFLTNDIGFKEAFNVCIEEETVDDIITNQEYIVGAIPCDRELVIFTYSETDQRSYIYRKPDGFSIDYYNKEDYKTNAVWKWNGGKITGTYTYNYKGELIIAFGEYDCPNDIKVPLKTLNLDTANYNQTYNIEEDIPTYDSSYDIYTNGNLVCGVYTFFIRFNIDEHNYTKWFQITGDINIIQEAQSKRYSHQYLDASSHLATEINLDPVEVNSNSISNKGITINIQFNNSKFNKFQLGYIIKRNSDISGRLQGEYIVEKVAQKISVVNNSFIDEVSVDKFLENPHQFFDVKNAITYNNRLYIANYEEHPVEDLSTFALNNVTVSVGDSSTNSARPVQSETSKVWNIVFDLSQTPRVGDRTKPNKWYPHLSIKNLKTNSAGYLDSNSKAALINFIANYLCILVSSDTDIEWVGNDNVNLYWFIQAANSNTSDSAICLAKRIKVTPEQYSGWGWDFNVPTYDIKFVGTDYRTFDIVIEVTSNNDTKTWSLLRKNGEHSCVLGYINENIMYFGNGFSHIYSDATIKPMHPTSHMPDDISITMTYVGNVDEGTPGEEDNDTSESGGTPETIGVNTRTLHPYQKYNFFIHYIRKDGSCTLGFPIIPEAKSFKLDSESDSNNTVIIPIFNAEKPNGDYVGYFISYEDVESTVDCVYITGNILAGTHTRISFTNAKYLYDLDNLRGSTIFINGVEYTLNSAENELKYIENRLTFNHIETYLLDTAGLVIDDDAKVAYYTKNIANIYNNKAKVLYRLTKNIYDWNTPISDDDYLPAFYNFQIIVTYKESGDIGIGKEVIIDPASSFVTGFSFIGDNNDSRTIYSAAIEEVEMYSDYPTQAMSIKEDFQQAAATLNVDKGNNETKTLLRVNTLISPDKLHDWLELKEAYRAKPSKRFTNFNIDNTYIFDKTIYRSNIISDESLVNNFRNFEPNNYKNIFENKGKIVNMIGIGLYLIVHTEQSIFIFDRTPKLTNRSQLDIPDVFDIDYQDFMPSNEGFGGLAEKEEAILTKNGYIWFDRVNKIIFNFENGKVSIISGDINNFLKSLDILYVRFAEDIIYNRLLVCIYANVKGNVESVTLSYSFNTNSFISIHDYKFTHNFRTSQKSYVLDTSKREILYEFDNTVKVDYKELYQTNSLFPVYDVRPEDDSSITGKSYIDVIFNKDYFIVKVVNSIRYLLNVIEDNINIYNITEENLDRRFSGNELKIYTDETDSGDLNISLDKANINLLNGYKYPYFEKGYWNLSYFRNKILVEVTDDEVKKSLGKDTVSTIENKLKSRSDNKSLIYGKYVVVRFIFNNNNNIKLDGVDIRTNEY